MAGPNTNAPTVASKFKDAHPDVTVISRYSSGHVQQEEVWEVKNVKSDEGNCKCDFGEGFVVFSLRYFWPPIIESCNKCEQGGSSHYIVEVSNYPVCASESIV